MKSNFKAMLILAGILILASPAIFSQSSQSVVAPPAPIPPAPASSKVDIKTLEDGNVSKDAAINNLTATFRKISDPSFEFFGKGSNSFTAILSGYGVAKESLDSANTQVDENMKAWEIFKSFAGIETDLKPTSKPMSVDEADDALMNFVVSKLLQPKQIKAISSSNENSLKSKAERISK